MKYKITRVMQYTEEMVIDVDRPDAYFQAVKWDKDHPAAEFERNEDDILIETLYVDC